jgi:hypothetical protein
MSLLGRFFGSRDDVPAWARFFAAPEYRAFLQAVEAELRRRGAPFEMGDGSVRAGPAGGPSADYGLLNLAQVCHASPPAEWPQAIAAHFDNAFASDAEADAFDVRARSFDDVRPSLRVRLYHPDYLSQVGSDHLVHRVPAEGLVETLVFDLPGTVRTVPLEHVERWDRPRDELFRIGLENVKAEPAPKVESLDLGQGAACRVITGDSYFVASHALFLGDYLDGPAPFGALVSVPHRHAVLFHAIADMRVILAIHSLIPVTFGMYQEGPGSISDSLYWWKDGEWMRLPSKVTAQSVTFEPPDRFVDEVLNRLPER